MGAGDKCILSKIIPHISLNYIFKLHKDKKIHMYLIRVVSTHSVKIKELGLTFYLMRKKLMSPYIIRELISLC